MADFLQAVQTGANLASMRQQQLERQQELRSRESLRQIQERQLAAQAEMLVQHANYYKQQAQMAMDQKLQDDSMLAASQDQFDYLKNELGYDEDAAHVNVIETMARANPKLAVNMANAYKAAKLATGGGTTEHQKVLEEQAAERLALQKEKATTSQEYLGLAKEKFDLSKERAERLANAPTAADRAEITEAYKQIADIRKIRDAIPEDETVQGVSPAGKEVEGQVTRPNQLKRMQLSKRIAGLREYARSLAPGRKKQAAAAVAPTALPPPPAGKVRLWDKNGKPGFVPEGQKDAALLEGYFEAPPGDEPKPADNADKEGVE